MVQVELLSSEWDEDAERFRPLVRARLSATGRAVRIEGEGDQLACLTHSIRDPKTGHSLHLHDDPERWLRLLPRHLRGDLTARLVEEREA